MKPSFRQGQSIIEVLIATTLISVGVIAALNLTNQSQKSTTYAKTLDAATAYNNQLADYLRNQKAALGYATLAEEFVDESTAGSVVYCLSTIPANSTAFLALNPGNCSASTFIPNTYFRRSLTVDTTSSAAGLLKLSIRTTWTDKTDHTATLNLELTQW